MPPEVRASYHEQPENTFTVYAKHHRESVSIEERQRASPEVTRTVRRVSDDDEPERMAQSSFDEEADLGPDPGIELDDCTATTLCCRFYHVLHLFYGLLLPGKLHVDDDISRLPDSGDQL